ncbi:MAG: hypothetical protein J6S85_04025 [Methanobrevibacter sp.]|nr:hypothetical protein [Methanobrevibacter sp.]MBO7712711.1 hypothetical protein [Methanobrevibacter sp.]
MIHHILWFFKSTFEAFRKGLENMVDTIAEKLSDFFGITLWIFICFPFLLLEVLFDILVKRSEMEKNYRKNVKAFSEWYRNHREG